MYQNNNIDIFKGKTKYGVEIDNLLLSIQNNKLNEIKKDQIVEFITFLYYICIENKWLNFSEFKD